MASRCVFIRGMYSCGIRTDKNIIYGVFIPVPKER